MCKKLQPRLGWEVVTSKGVAKAIPGCFGSDIIATLIHHSDMGLNSNRLPGSCVAISLWTTDGWLCESSSL